jgi:hypothetical protein
LMVIFCSAMRKSYLLFVSGGGGKEVMSSG